MVGRWRDRRNVSAFMWAKVFRFVSHPATFNAKQHSVLMRHILLLVAGAAVIAAATTIMML